MLLLLALPVGLAALASASGLLRLPYELFRIEQTMPATFRLHMAASGLALLLMPIAIATHGFRVHKLLGRSAAVLGVLGGVTALPVAVASEASLVARMGFFAQGVAWVMLLGLAVVAIRRGRRARHRWLMLTAIAVASGAIWLRLATWAAVTFGAEFGAIYAAAAWLAWIVPAAVVLLMWRFQSRTKTAPIPDAISLIR